MPKRFRVVITDFLHDADGPEHQHLDDIADVVALGARTRDELIGRIDDADAIIIYHDAVLDRALIERLKHCKLIVRGGVGLDNVDAVAARERGIDVANVPDYGTEEVADSALTLMLSMTRGVSALSAQLRADATAWSHQYVAPLRRLRGETLGIIGLGRIGTAMALRGKAVGMDVAFYDPYIPDGRDKAIGVRRVETLDELLGESYVVSLHCPLTDETRDMIDAAAIARMPQGSYLVNTARGASVDPAAVADAIGSGHLAGAGLDVLPTEPPADDDPLMTAWRNPSHPAHLRVIITPHAAFYSEQGLMDIRIKTALACRRALLGEPQRNVVN
jgi:D-3-phosphoglycerate dehydrogenase/C-terminal binding protein